jgi:hypothetical protein
MYQRLNNDGIDAQFKDPRYDRDLEEDISIAFKALMAFKKILDDLNPVAKDVVLRSMH